MNNVEHHKFAVILGGVLLENVHAVLQGVQKRAKTFFHHKIYYILGKVKKFQSSSLILR